MCVNGNGRIPKEVARQLLETHKLSQIVIVAKTQSGVQICVTDGFTQKDKENAQAAGKVWDLIMSLGHRKGPTLMQTLRTLAR